MVHADNRDAERMSEAVGGRGADQQRARQARAFRVGNSGELLQATAGLLQQSAGERQQAPDVIAGGELRHHAPIVGVQPRLGVEHVSEQAAVAVVERDPGLVAGGLDAQNPHLNVFGKWS